MRAQAGVQGFAHVCDMDTRSVAAALDELGSALHSKVCSRVNARALAGNN